MVSQLNKNEVKVEFFANCPALLFSARGPRTTRSGPGQSRARTCLAHRQSESWDSESSSRRHLILRSKYGETRTHTMQEQNTKPIIPKVRYHPTIQNSANGEQTKTRTRQAPRARRLYVHIPQTAQENPQADPEPSAQRPRNKPSQRATPKPDSPHRVAPPTDGAPPTPPTSILTAITETRTHTMQEQNTKPIVPKVWYHPTIQNPANGEQTKARTRQAPRARQFHVHLPQTAQENPQADPEPSAQRPKNTPSQRATPKLDSPMRVAPPTDGAPPTPEQVPLGVNVGLDMQAVEQVEALTRGQRTNQDWFSWRKNRITASMAHSVAHSRFANGKSQTPPTSILTAITGEKPGIKTRAMSWGIENEAKAVCKYQVKKSADMGRSVSVQDCGLFIDPQRAWLAASPDGIVTDSQTGRWLICLEVKCPYKHRDRRVEEACKEDPAFCLEIQDENGKHPGGPPTYHLKESHSYFTQIQCQLAVTGLKQADLVVYTRKETAIVPVKFDSDLWEETLSKLEVFYRDAVLPHLREKKQQEPGAAWTVEL